jgi:hypothetical protein
MAAKYLVQVRRTGEPWLTVERSWYWALAKLAAMRVDADGLHVRVIYKGRELFNPRRPSCPA